ncbi:MAG: hypothetical protein AAF772_01780 [Acidobacteriota bacterium]
MRRRLLRALTRHPGGRAPDRRRALVDDVLAQLEQAQANASAPLPLAYRYRLAFTAAFESLRDDDAVEVADSPETVDRARALRAQLEALEPGPRRAFFLHVLGVSDERIARRLARPSGEITRWLGAAGRALQAADPELSRLPRPALRRMLLARGDGGSAEGDACRRCRASRMDCPSPADLWDAAHGAAPRSRNVHALDRAVTCAVCAAGWQLARDLRPPRRLRSRTLRRPLGAARGRAGLAAGAMGASSRHPLQILQLAVLSVALLLASVLIFVASHQQLTHAVRSSSSSSTAPAPIAASTPPVRGPVELLQPSSRSADAAHTRTATTRDNAALPRDDFVVRWTGGVRMRFDIQLYQTDSDRLLWQTRNLPTPQAQVPKHVFDRVPDHAALHAIITRRSESSELSIRGVDWMAPRGARAAQEPWRDTRRLPLRLAPGSGP